MPYKFYFQSRQLLARLSLQVFKFITANKWWSTLLQYASAQSGYYTKYLQVKILFDDNFSIIIRPCLNMLNKSGNIFGGSSGPPPPTGLLLISFHTR